MAISGDIPGNAVAMNYENISVDSTAVGFSTSEMTRSTVKDGGNASHAFEGAGFTIRAKAAFVTLEDADVRFTLDGTAATGSTGHLLEAGDSIVITGTQDLQRASFIAPGSAASMHVTYFTW